MLMLVLVTNLDRGFLCWCVLVCLTLQIFPLGKSSIIAFCSKKKNKVQNRKVILLNYDNWNEKEWTGHPLVILESSWCHLGVILESSWVILKSSWIILESILFILDSSWVILDSSWVILDSSWVILDSSWVMLDSSWMCHDCVMNVSCC